MATTFTDTVGSGSTFTMPSNPPELGNIDGCAMQPGTHRYAARPLTTANSTLYTFNVTSSTGFSNGQGSDPFLAIYAGSFNPASPATNLIACNDDQVPGSNLRPRFQANLSAHTTYIIVTTSWATNVSGTATYDVTPDVTLAGAPELSGVSVSGVTSTTATLQGTSTSAGTGYFVVQLAAQAPPSAAQVIAGQQSTGGAALFAGSNTVAVNTQRTFPLASLQPGTAYIAYLVVRDNQIPQLTSVAVAANFTTVAVVPQAPTIGTATAGNAEATVAFTAPAINGGSPITGYTVTSSPGAISATGSTSPITVPGLTNGTSYTFTVRANNAIGAGPASAASNAVTPVGPPTLTNFGPFFRVFGTAASAITAPTSPSAGVFTYTSSNPAVATISGNVVTVVSVGQTVITASQAANGGFTAATITATLDVTAAPAVLSGFDNLTRVFGGAPFTLTAPTSNSNGALSYTSSNPAVATISGTTVTVVGAGTTTLTATQAATANYQAGSATATLTVGAAVPTLTNFNAINRTFGATPITLTAPASPSTGAFTYTSSNPAVATVSGNTVTIVGAGTSTITATQAANGNYASAQTTALLTVGVAVPTLTNFNAINRIFGTAPVTLTAPTSPSTGAFTYTSSNPAVATISGNTVTIIGAGTSTITATQAANGNYASAQTTAVLTVSAAVPTLTNFSAINATFGAAPVTLTAPTSPSTGAFTYTSSNPAVATISGSTVTIIGAGTSTITATQAANGNYASAQTTALLTVGAAVPTLGTFGNLNATFGAAPITLVAPTSPSAGAFTYTSSNPAVATISGNTVTIIGAGTSTITATQAANGNYASAQTTAVLTVGAAVPTLGNFNAINATFGDGPVTLTAPASPSTGAFTYTSSNPAVATISGNVITIVGSGNSTITATQAANGNYASAQTTAALTVATAVPTLSNFNAINATFGDAPITLAAPASNSAGTFTYTSSNPAVATISGNVVTIVGSGNATITATQAANGNYASAQTTASLTVGAATPTLGAFGNLNATFGDAPITLVAPTSPSAGAFTYTSSNPAVATVSGNAVTIVGSGNATITAMQAADGNYAAAQTTASLTVGAATPTLGAFGNLNATFGDAPITLIAPTSSSAGAFTYTSSNPAVATVSGNVVTIVGSGNATITAMQAPDGNYAAAQTTASLTVGAAVPTLGTFGNLNATFGDAPITLVAPTSPSAGAFTYTSSNPAVATISGNTVTIVGAGTSTITATQVANGNYASAQATAALTVGAAVPTLSNFNAINATFGDAPITLAAPASNSTGAFTYTSSNPTVATISGNVVTIVGSGSATITATQAADGNYAAASTTASLNVDVAAPTLSSFSAINATFGDAPITLVAPTSPSAGAFTYTSSNPAVATISGNVVTIVGSGSATITATQAADGNYAAASTTASLNVDVAAPTLANFNDLNAIFGDAPITLVAPTSPSAGAFTYTSSNPAVATISGNVVTIVGSGNATITATQAADGNYGTAQATVQLAVSAAVPTLGTFGNLNAIFGDAPITLTSPTSNSTGAFTYTSSNPAVATISGNVVTIVGSGSATITATQAANGNYTAAQTTASLTVGAAIPVLGTFGNLNAIFGDAPISLVAPTSPSAGTFTYASSNPAVATISGNVVTIVGSGSATITAAQAADGNYAAAQATATLTVGAAIPVLGTFGNLNAIFGDAPITLVAPTSPSAGAFTYTSSNPAVATISGNVVTIVGSGSATITATQAADGNYASTQTTASLTVGAAVPTLGTFGNLNATFGDAPITLTAPTSPSAGAFTYTSSNPAVATLSGNVVTIVGSGNATITATQAADGNYASSQTTATLTVGTAVPTLGTFGNLNATFGDAPITLTAPTSDSAGAFTYTSSNPAVATISGNVVTIVGSGNATITATQAADGNYASTQTTATLTVGTAVPTLGTFGNLNATFGDAPITLVAPTSPSAGAFTYTSSNPAVATISGNVVTIVGSGNATITATQAADGNYAAAQTTATLTVGTAVPTLGTFGNLNATFGDAPITLTAPTSDSAGAFTYTSSNPAVATISGNVVTIVGSGSATITATQAADGNYASTQTTASLSVGAATPSLGAFGNLNATFGDAPITLVAPTSPSAGAFTYTSSNPAVATISGNVVTIVGSGSVTITATQAADGNYASTQTTASLAVGAAIPVLGTFGNLNATFGDAPITLVAPTSPSAGAFTYTSSNPAVATISGNVVTIVGSGSATITATQAADGNYASTQTTASLTVGAAVPTLGTFGNLNATFGDAPITLTAPASPSTGAFTYTSSNPAVATISGNVVTIVGSGNATITATQVADGNYASTQTTAQLQVGVAAATLSNFGNLTATFGDAPITLVAPTSPSAGAFTYTSSNPAVATISGNVVTIVGSGTTTITATQAADGNYAGAQITAQLGVGTLAPALSGFGNLAATYGQAAITLTAPTSPSAGAFTYTSSNPEVATISGNVVTIVGTGTTTLTATQAANGSYAEASVTAQLVVGAAAPAITGFEDLHKIYGQAAFDLVDPTSNSTGAFTYTIDNAAVATISGRTVTLTGAGTATITATQPATANYAAGSVTALLVVDSRPDPTQDAEVAGGLQAQMDTALRFANAQQSNVRDRLRQRRATDAAGMANGLSLNSSGGDGGVSLQPEVLGEEGGSGKAWSLWTGGAINAGERKRNGNDNDYDFRSDGVTIGADTRLGKNVLLGVAVGGGWGDTDVGSHGSTVDATQRAMTVYGLWHASDSLFIDGQLAVGKLDYDLRRWSTDANSMGIAQRDGSQVFGSVTFGYESSNESRRLTSYGRIDAGRTTLDAYRETGLGIYDLDYREQTVEQRSIAVGLEGSHNVKVDWARDVRPYWQVEYRNDFSSRSNADINYVVAPADADYRLSLKPWASSNWNVGFGADFAFGNGVIVTALLRHELNVGMGSNTTIGLQFSLDFGGDEGAATATDAPLQSMQDFTKSDYKKK